jgi:DNA mismatch repair protein MLH1
LEDEKNCFQSVSAALGNFYAMHPPMLPNPSGYGLQFYKKRKPLRNLEDEEKTSDDIGMDVRC